MHDAFYARSSLDVAPDLLGKFLVTETHAGMVTEVEAYDGPDDQACHGRFGRTKRTEVMFGPPGYFYVYLIYGMYFMLNVVTDREGYPSAVLIRGTTDIDGPGRLTKGYGIDGSFNGKSITKPSGLWIEERGVHVPSNAIERTPRIGVAYAGAWAQKPYRFVWRPADS